jgi:hypothetical protein
MWKIAGFALVLDNEVLHVSLFEKKTAKVRSATVPECKQYSRRRRNRTWKTVCLSVSSWRIQS